MHAAKILSNKYNVKIVEQDGQKCFELADALPDVMVINGDGRNVELLEEENINEMDAFIAVTGDAETNIISCLMAKNMGVKNHCHGRKHGLHTLIAKYWRGHNDQ